MPTVASSKRRSTTRRRLIRSPVARRQSNSNATFPLRVVEDAFRSTITRFHRKRKPVRHAGPRHWCRPLSHVERTAVTPCGHTGSLPAASATVRPWALWPKGGANVRSFAVACYSMASRRQPHGKDTAGLQYFADGSTSSCVSRRRRSISNPRSLPVIGVDPEQGRSSGTLCGSPGSSSGPARAMV
jgi:hypothetical protein